jgi:hypothetical protein
MSISHRSFAKLITVLAMGLLLACSAPQHTAAPATPSHGPITTKPLFIEFYADW